MRSRARLVSAELSPIKRLPTFSADLGSSLTFSNTSCFSRSGEGLTILILSRKRLSFGLIFARHAHQKPIKPAIEAKNPTTL